eukprot:3798885-Amphidinium_carterae.2
MAAEGIACIGNNSEEPLANAGGGDELLESDVDEPQGHFIVKRKRGRPKVDPSDRKISRARSKRAVLADVAQADVEEHSEPLLSISLQDLEPLGMSVVVRDALQLPSQVSQLLVRHSGYNMLSPLCSGLVGACASASAKPSARDSDYEAIVRHFFPSTGQYHMSSLTTAAEKLKMSLAVLQRKLWRLMCAQLMFARLHRFALERQLLLNCGDGLSYYLDYNLFDETPMRASMKGHSPHTRIDSNNIDMEAFAFPSFPDIMKEKLWNHNMAFKFLQTACGRFTLPASDM